MSQSDARDYALMCVYLRLRVNAHARHILLFGLAAFNRNVTAG